MSRDRWEGQRKAHTGKRRCWSPGCGFSKAAVVPCGQQRVMGITGSVSGCVLL